MERNKNTSSLKRTRFEARKNVTAPSGSRDAIVETLIFNTAKNFPFRSITYPRISTFLPCFATPMCYLTHMDNLMSSTERWTENCMGWVPPYSQIYIGILFYIQTFRAMECAGLLSAGSEILTLLNGFLTVYPLDSVYVPGPLVQCFKNISCFWPCATDRFGNVSPSIPARPGWSQDLRYRLKDHLTTHLPHIYLFASRLRSTCNAATRANVSESSFTADVDGPKYLATLFSQPCDLNANNIANMTGPGASHAYAGNLKLWQKAAAQIDLFGCCPILLDVNEHEVVDSWASFLGFDESTAWFGSLNAMMAKYCQFWRASRPLSECSPSGSAAGAVVCRQLSGLINKYSWNARKGTHNATTHKSDNQIGHYSMNETFSLKFSAATTIEDIPEDHLYAASTYNVNLLPVNSDAANYHHGRFWDIFPNTRELTRTEIIPGVLDTITCEFHSDSRIYPDHA
ncbi:unnamed protein product [Trifolium pratense]|uniref:Uncharacterized protein n=1 Tax=Trifolium pratense TaxID=57577 RepID=A0ACB0J829_TRIPR|nr:unnamed protein product [Trifolium pratense]